MDPDQLLTTKEAAALLVIAEHTLQNMRTAGTGPLAVRIGSGRKAKVRYRRQDLADWVASRVEQVVGATPE